MSIGSLKDNGQIAESPKDKAEMLNNQFCSVFTQENLNYIPSKGESPYRAMARIHVTVNGVIKSIKRLNIKKASGPDKMPIITLKETVSEISPVLQSLFQQSLDTHEIPSDWKLANIVPIYKKGDRTKPSNYRPVSLTAVASKMLEHIVVSQIMNHLDHNNILHENQHGFRTGRSCETQLLLSTDDITRHMNQGYQVDMAILDFAKAFDKVTYRRLAEKLSYYGIRDDTLSWVNAFLYERQQQVVIDGETSRLTTVTSGVPQGTVLGPTLFLVYINDIAANISSTIRLFADDCVVYRAVQSKEDHIILQKDLNTLVEWSNTWQMEFNVSKCAIMNITTKRNKSIFEYSMAGQKLSVVKHHPYLGVELSENMKYNIHIENIISKASQVLGFLKRNLRHCPKPVKERAYMSLVRPKLEYSSTIWNPQQKTQTKQIEQLQRNAARFVLNQPYDHKNPSSVTTMLQQLRWPTLEQRRSSADLILMYKIVYQLVAVPIGYLPTTSIRYEMDNAVYMCSTNSIRRTNMKFVAYQCAINAYQHSFFPRVVIPWNRLPESTLMQTTLDSFKAVLQPTFAI
jgi:hypothetical protein